MKYTAIEIARENEVMIIRLNRPERMNAVNEAMYTEIQDVLNKTGADHEIRSLIITGSVLKRHCVEKQAFCAGADLKDHSSGRRDQAARRAYIELAHETTRMIYSYPKPTIAAVNGPARGAGLEMAINCDFILMAETATMAFTEVGLGTFVGGASTSLLPTLIGMTKAKELIYTCKVIDGNQALALGLASRTVPVAQLTEAALSLANELSEKAPISMRMAKNLLHSSRLYDIETALKHETEAILACMETEDWHEGIRAFAEKRKPVYTGK
ncbi:MAG: enoyl-CoA hydratase/isomerase family protein [bacterium]